MIDKLSNIFGKNATKKSKKKKEIEIENDKTSINNNNIKKIDIYDDIFEDVGKYIPVGAIDSKDININNTELNNNNCTDIEKITNNVIKNDLNEKVDLISQTGLFNDWASNNNDNKEIDKKKQESRLANVNSLLNSQANREKAAKEREEKKLELASSIYTANNSGNSIDKSIVHRNVFAADDDIKRTAGGMTMSGGSYDTVGFDTNDVYNDSDSDNDNDDDGDGNTKHKITVVTNSSVGNKRIRENNDNKSNANKSNKQNDNRASRRAKENDNK